MVRAAVSLRAENFGKCNRGVPWRSRSASGGSYRAGFSRLGLGVAVRGRAGFGDVGEISVWPRLAWPRAGLGLLGAARCGKAGREGGLGLPVGIVRCAPGRSAAHRVRWSKCGGLHAGTAKSALSFRFPVSSSYPGSWNVLTRPRPPRILPFRVLPPGALAPLVRVQRPGQAGALLCPVCISCSSAQAHRF